MSKVDINNYHLTGRERIHHLLHQKTNARILEKIPASKHSVRQFKIDGDVFLKGTGPQRCDFLLLNDIKKVSYYIELKGSDVSKATVQIDSTVDMISPSLPGYEILRRIVYRSGTHGVNDPKILAWKRKYVGTYRVERTKIEDVIS